MEMNIASEYNYTIPLDDEIIVYNSYSGLILSTSDPLESIQLSSEKEEWLRTQGFLKPTETKEIDKFLCLRDRLLHSGHLNVTCIPSFSCSFNCIYCYEKKNTRVISNDTKEQLYKYIKSNIGKYNSISITFFGG